MVTSSAMGEQIFRFREKVEAVANPPQWNDHHRPFRSQWMNRVAELIFVGPDFLDTPARLPLNEKRSARTQPRDLCLPKILHEPRHCKIYPIGAKISLSKTWEAATAPL